MAERKTGAGMHLSGVLERAPQPKPIDDVEESEPVTGTKSRGGLQAVKPGRAVVPRTAKRVKGRTVYIGDDLFERIIVQAHRRDVTISDYVCLLLERHVPDHRVVRSGGSTVTVEPGETDAA